MEGFFLNNEILPGYTRVTEVLYPFSGLTKVDPEVLRNASERGTKVHAVCEAMIEGLGTCYEDSISGYVKSFEQWCEGKKFIPKPPRFYCDQYKITGECDAIYEEESGLVLVDFKTPVNESKTWKLQASAYSYLAKLYALPLHRLEFVKLNKAGNAPKIFLYEEDFQFFLNCLQIYRTFFENARQESSLDYL